MRGRLRCQRRCWPVTLATDPVAFLISGQGNCATQPYQASFPTLAWQHAIGSLIVWAGDRPVAGPRIISGTGLQHAAAIGARWQFYSSTNGDTYSLFLSCTGRLAPFLELHPALKVELLMSDRRVDLLDEGVDLAIRLGAQTDSSFVTRRLASAPRYLVASPGYVEKRGAPAKPVELQSHDIILNQSPGSGVWNLRDADGSETSMKLNARLVATSVEGVLAAAVAGLGIAATSLFACRPELARGELMRVLGEHRLSPIDVHAVFPAGRRPPAKARAFVEYLAQAIA